jgi:hypothetical protein
LTDLPGERACKNGAKFWNQYVLNDCQKENHCFSFV